MIKAKSLPSQYELTFVFPNPQLINVVMESIDLAINIGEMPKEGWAWSVRSVQEFALDHDDEEDEDEQVIVEDDD